MWQQLKIVSNIEKLLTISVVEYEGGRMLRTNGEGSCKNVIWNIKCKCGMLNRSFPLRF